ncbi:MAG: type II toxin-antitoxin system VapB family antitoxin [Burkholderiaceae bacterium]|nr:type II toxin-antitoxin system VapB family antitoxin [Burkholderiaceae bacterium]
MDTRTNIVLDDRLVAKAMKRAGVKTKKAAIEAALRAYVAKPDYSGLLALAGTGVIADDYDPKGTFNSAQSHDALMAALPRPTYGAGKASATPKRSR